MKRKRIKSFKNEKLFYVTISLCLLSALALAGINMYTASEKPSEGYYVDLSQLDNENARRDGEFEDVGAGQETTGSGVQADHFEDDNMFGLDNVMDATDEVDDALMEEREAILEGKAGQAKVQDAAAAGGAAQADATGENAEAAGAPGGAETATAAQDAAGDGAGTDTALAQAADEAGDTSQIEAAEAMTGADAAYTEGSPLKWPVAGNVLLKYSMDRTIYFPTLRQYKYNPGIVIASQVDTPVTASHAGEVTEISQNEELGTYVRIDMGNDFQTVYGQLKDIPCQVGDHVEEGAVIGYISEPTKYYSEEGPHLYFEMQRANGSINPLDYLE